ncbi:MAG: SusF/SusE family outer membrane protein, partial [Bacteroidetes bacterium]|nr:SusF/SusE family outer membrane protein [Bacteroidota bacterium]
SPASYNVSNLPATSYVLQMDIAENNFDNALDLAKITETTFSIKVGTINTRLTVLGVVPEVATDVEFRLYSYATASSGYSDLYSNPITLNITTYEVEVVEKFIHLLGDATPVGWDNTAALPMTQIKNGVFARVETLDPTGSWFKFISMLGFWAPQWGTDATGTAEAGPLVYRPDEATTDPPAMPSPDVLGDYYIEADTINLEYRTFLTSGELYLVGAATTVGWDHNSALPFTEVEPNIFEITTTLTDGGMKFLEVVGQWAPQWGLNSEQVSTGGNLSYRPSETVTDPPEIPSPGSGNFKIVVDLTTITYTITPQ